MSDPSPREILEALWQRAGLAGAAPALLAGEEPALPSSFRIGAAAQASIAAATAAVAEIHRRRGGPAQAAAVDMRHAALEFASERYLRLDGTAAPAHWDDIAGTYRCGDGRWVRLHTNFPHHRAGVLRLLGCEGTRAAVGKALQDWEGFAFEQSAAEAGMCVAAMRSFAEWDAHPQGRAVAALPPLRIERIAEAPPVPLPNAGARPLEGIRVLEATRVIAGPVCGRTLAAHGADVLHISAAHLPSFDDLLPDTGRGKRTAALDLRTEAGRATLRGLAAGADIFLQGYRPGAVAGHGFAPEALAAARPGIVCVSLSAYGEVGPWGGRRGFDSLVQTASGFNHAEAVAADAEPADPAPRVLPCQALDHASGFLLAFGALAALLRRAEEGGSWLVRVSLAGTAQWLRGLGRIEGAFGMPVPKMEELGDLLEQMPSGFGRLTSLRHSGRLPETPPYWALPPVPLGTHAAAWV
ncbi:CoA transferase [Paracraurococcus lichenis]|uniref:CoA transferase n=1 Tax=Paracraurococcus lichenis TaxID=3064888 RepID=A0ABT9E5E6_9PROT|nr:CoA transferase [Paracraurococcus sp. LOR1-02]MDO9711396.1 CoA transferase [Paracraurococcus sp. LOR1-02]